MKVENLWDMVKQGYSAQDIADMRKLEKEIQSEVEPEVEKEIDAESNADGEPEVESDEKEEEPNYKKLYENSQKALREAQEENLIKDNGKTQENQTDEEIINNWARTFM